jgi:hypothetical protein
MTLNQVSSWGNRTGKIGTIICLLFSLAILDALSARLREPSNHFPCLPGSRIAVNGPFAGPTNNLQELIYVSSSKGIQLIFEATQTGFWLGGHWWNGTLNIEPQIQPGTYNVTVRSQNTAGGKSGSLFQIEVYKDLKAYGKTQNPFFRDIWGLIPGRLRYFSFLYCYSPLGVFFIFLNKEKGSYPNKGKRKSIGSGRMERMMKFSLGWGVNKDWPRGIALS